MEWLLSSGGGHSLFDLYSIQHMVWSFALIIALAALKIRRPWLWASCVVISWEVLEWWIVDHLPRFPFAGREDLINKAVGDIISDTVGFLLGIVAIRAVYVVMKKHRLGGFPILLERAKELATKAHEGQRYGKFPYTHHLFGTWDVLEKFGFSEEDPDPAKRVRSQRLILAAILHDTLEDTGLTYETLVDEFGIQVAALVFAVTNEPGANRKERFLKTYPKIRANPDAIVLKLADRIANVIHALQANPDILGMYRKEWPTFEAELRKPSECDDMWKHLELILKEST